MSDLGCLILDHRPWTMDVFLGCKFTKSSWFMDHGSWENMELFLVMTWLSFCVLCASLCFFVSFVSGIQT